VYLEVEVEVEGPDNGCTDERRQTRDRQVVEQGATELDTAHTTHTEGGGRPRHTHRQAHRQVRDWMLP
jgi:hypothetical protein